jgi:hypothetical protein
MTSLRMSIAAFCAISFALCTPGALAQSGGAQPEQQKPAAADAAAKDAAAKEGQKKVDQMAEAAKVLVGPAGNPECVWTGTRVVGRLVSDDLDAAFRHLDLYDRFGCPSAHIQASFRCMARVGQIDLKAQDKVNDRVFACWLNPGLTPAPAAAANNQPANGTEGTTARQ